MCLPLRDLVKLKTIQKSEKNSDWPDPDHPPAYPIFYYFFLTFENMKTKFSQIYVACRGNTPLFYHPSPLISHPLSALTSVKNEVNWSFVYHGLQVTKHPRHPHLGTKGDMGRCYPLLGFHSRVRTGYFNGKKDKLFDKNTFPCIFWLLVAILFLTFG